MFNFLSKIELFNVLILYSFFLFGIVRYLTKNKVKLKIKKIDLLLIFILIITRIIAQSYVNPELIIPSIGNVAQSWSYSCQGIHFIENINIFEKSVLMANCHFSHPIGFGIFIGIIYFIFGLYQAPLTIFIIIFSILNSILIYFFIKPKLIGFVSALAFLLSPIFLLNSSFPSPEYFAAFFIILFMIFKDRKLNNELIILLISIIAILPNIKFEYGFFALALSLYLLFRVIKEKKNIQITLILFLIIALFNTHLIYRYSDVNQQIENTNNLEDFKENINHNIFNEILISLGIFSAILLIFSKNVNFLGFIFVLLFYFSFSKFTITSIRYLFVLLICFFIPFIFIKDIKYTKLIILILLFGFQVYFVNDLNPLSDFISLSKALDDIPFKNVKLKQVSFTREQLKLYNYKTNKNYSILNENKSKGYFLFIDYFDQPPESPDCKIVEFNSSAKIKYLLTLYNCS